MMMKYVHLVLVFFLFSLNGMPLKAQQVIDAEDVDYLMIYNNTLLFYKQYPDDRYSARVLYNFDDEENNKSGLPPIIELTGKDKEEFKLSEADIAVLVNEGLFMRVDNMLIASTPSDLENMPMFKLGNVSEFKYNSDESVVFSRFSQSLFCIQIYKEDAEMKEYYNMDVKKQISVGYYGYYYVKIAPEKYAMVLFSDNNPSKFIIPQDDNMLFVYYDELNILNDSALVDAESSETYRTDAFKSFDTDLYTVSPSGEKFILTDRFGDNLLNTAYDSLKVTKHHVIGYDADSKRYAIYNAALERLDNGNARAVIPFEDGFHLEFIDGSELKFASYKILEYRPSPEVRGISISVSGNVYSLEKYLKTYRLVIKPYSDNVGTTATRKAILIGGNDIEEIRFLNNKTDDFIVPDEMEIMHPSNWVMVKKNGKYGIASYKLSATGKNFTLNEVLPAVFDSLALEGYSYPVKFYKDDLVGYFPVMKEAKYKKLDYEGVVFARFTLPSGKEGWINMETGEQFFDESK